MNLAKVENKLDPIIIEERVDKKGKLRSRLQYINTNSLSKDSAFVYIPKWLLITGSFISLAILVTIVSSIFIITLRPNPALYKEDCATRSCIKNLGLYCINQTCQCKPSQTK